MQRLDGLRRLRRAAPRTIGALIGALLVALIWGCAQAPHEPREAPASPAAAASQAEVDPELAALLARLRTDESSQRRETRERIIAVGPVAVPPLLERIHDPDWNVRWKVVNLLGYLEDTRATQPLVERVVVDPNLHVRWRALWAVTALDDDDRARAELERWFRQPEHRWNAAVGLSMFGSLEALPVLSEGTRSEDDWIRFEAVNGLGRIHDENTSLLLAGLLEHPQQRTRQDAVMSLGKIRDEVAVTALIAALEDPSPQVRWRAAMGLKLSGACRVPSTATLTPLPAPCAAQAAPGAGPGRPSPVDAGRRGGRAGWLRPG